MKISPYLRIRQSLAPPLTLSEAKSLLLRIRTRRRILHVLFDRLAALAFMSLCPAIMLFRHRKVTANRLIIAPGKGEPHRKFRERFILEYTDSQDKQEAIPQLNGTYFAYALLSRQRIWRITKLWWVFWKATAGGIWYWNSTPLITLPFDFLITASLVCLPNTDCYIFAAYTIDSYFIARLNEILGASRVNISLGNGFVYRSNRYTYLPNSHLIICSKSQKPAVAAFVQRNWFRVGKTSFWGLEDVGGLSSSSPVEPHYDVGIYSSGQWARIEGLYRVSNWREVRNLPENQYNHIFVHEILLPLLALADAGELRVKLYLHPYERFLLHRRAIVPPYFNLIESSCIDIDASPGSSVSGVRECQVGVSLCSSMILDRWHMGLDGLLYSGVETDPMYRTEYLGELQAGFFSDRDELLRKLRAIIQREPAIRRDERVISAAR